MIVKTDAIVLKTMKFGDTSKIVTFFTSEYGKVKCVAKGARGNKHKFGSSLEPLQIVSLVLYKKEQRELQLVTQSDSLIPIKKISENLDVLSSAFSVLEILNRVTQEESPNVQLFQAGVDTIQTMEEHPEEHAFALQQFFMHTCIAIGFAPSLESCANCGTSAENISSIERVAFQTAKGTFLCANCNSSGSRPAAAPKRFTDDIQRSSVVTIDVGTLQRLRHLTRSMTNGSSLKNLHSESEGEVVETLRLYLRYHIEDHRPLNSELLVKSFIQEEV